MYQSVRRLLEASEPNISLVDSCLEHVAHTLERSNKLAVEAKSAGGWVRFLFELFPLTRDVVRQAQALQSWLDPPGFVVSLLRYVPVVNWFV